MREKEKLRAGKDDGQTRGLTDLLLSPSALYHRQQLARTRICEYLRLVHGSLLVGLDPFQRPPTRCESEVLGLPSTVGEPGAGVERVESLGSDKVVRLLR